MGVSKNRGTPKRMIYNGKPYLNGWFGGTTIFGNIHIFCCFSAFFVLIGQLEKWTSHDPKNLAKTSFAMEKKLGLGILGAARRLGYATAWWFAVITKGNWMIRVAISYLNEEQNRIDLGNFIATSAETTPKWWFSKGNPLILGKSRLMKNYNLSRSYLMESHTSFWGVASTFRQVIEANKVCSLKNCRCCKRLSADLSLLIVSNWWISFQWCVGCFISVHVPRIDTCCSCS